jgi:hypothetical protein
MADATTAHFRHHLSFPSFHDAHFIDTHLETKETRPFRLDRHRSFRKLDRYEQLYRGQLWNPPDPVKDMKGTRREVWHEGRIKQTLAVRPVWLRTCHCVDCVRFRFIEKDKEKRAEIVCAIKRIEWSGGCHPRQAYPCDCWDSLCTGCLWDMPSVREKDGIEAGESHPEGYDPQRVIPLEVDILDLLILPRRSRRRGECHIGSALGRMFTIFQHAQDPISCRARGHPLPAEAPSIPTPRARVGFRCTTICRSMAPLWIGITAVLRACEVLTSHVGDV